MVINHDGSIEPPATGQHVPALGSESRGGHQHSSIACWEIFRTFTIFLAIIIMYLMLWLLLSFSLSYHRVVVWTKEGRNYTWPMSHGTVTENCCFNHRCTYRPRNPCSSEKHVFISYGKSLGKGEYVFKKSFLYVIVLVVLLKLDCLHKDLPGIAPICDKYEVVGVVGWQINSFLSYSRQNFGSIYIYL